MSYRSRRLWKSIRILRHPFFSLCTNLITLRPLLFFLSFIVYWKNYENIKIIVHFLIDSSKNASDVLFTHVFGNFVIKAQNDKIVHYSLISSKNFKNWQQYHVFAKKKKERVFILSMHNAYSIGINAYLLIHWVFLWF